MDKHQDQFRQYIEGLSAQWIARGLPSREALLKAAEAMDAQRAALNSPGLWPTAPRMLTATLDDGIGQGLDIIERFAQSMGMSVRRIGLLQPPDAIVAACGRTLPRYLGLTVLQLDSDEALAAVGHHLPPQTQLIAGGPAFKFDPDMAQRCGVRYMAANVAKFMDYVLKDAISGTR